MAASKAIGFLNFKFGADLSGFERAMKKAQKRLTKFGKNIQRTGKSMTMGLTLPIVALGATALKLASDLEEVNSKFNTVFESIQKEANETARVFKDSFGLSELAAKQLLSDTGDLLTGFGFTEKAALDLSSQVNTLAVDLASFTNFEGGAEGASKALTKALVGETESAKSLGIVIRQGTKEYKARTQEIMKEQGVTELQAKALNNLEIVTSQSQKAIGDFERTQGSFANQLRIVKGDLVDLGSELGTRLLPLAQKFIEWIKDLMEKFDSLTPKQKDNVVKWGLIAAAIGPVLIVIGKLSIGLGALIPIFVKIGSFLIANPYIALAAAIGILAYAIYDVTSALTSQVNVSKELEDLNNQAQKSISEDIVNIELLTATIENENNSLEDKQKALETLKETYPGYYDEIDETTLSTDNLRKSTERLIGDMTQIALLTAYKDKLKDIKRAVIDLKHDTNDASTSTSLLTHSLTGAVGQLLDLDDALQGELNTKEIEDLGIVYQNVLDEAVDLQEQVDKLPESLKDAEKFKHRTPSRPSVDTEKSTKSFQEINAEIQMKMQKTLEEAKVNHIKVMSDLNQKSYNEEIERLERYYQLSINVEKENLLNQVITKEEYDKRIADGEIAHLDQMKQFAENYSQDVIDIDTKTLDAKLANQEKQYSNIEDQFEGVLTWQQRLTDAQLMLNAGAGLFSDILTNSLTSALDSQENFFNVFVENIKKAIKQLLIQLAVMTLISAIMPASLGGMGKGAFSLASIQGNLASIMNIQLADGGIVTGPTTALIGEAGPEAVIPLDRLNQYSGGQNITVTGKLVGNDIYLSNERTKFNRNRTV